MKRTIIILSIVLTLSVAGVLYGKHLQNDQKETNTLEEAYSTQLPEQMPGRRDRGLAINALFITIEKYFFTGMFLDYYLGFYSLAKAKPGPP